MRALYATPTLQMLLFAAAAKGNARSVTAERAAQRTHRLRRRIAFRACKTNKNSALDGYQSSRQLISHAHSKKSKKTILISRHAQTKTNKRIMCWRGENLAIYLLSLVAVILG